MSALADTPAGPAPAAWLEASQGAWLLSLRVQPGARRTEPQGIADGRLRLRLAAPPVEGKANEALLRWVAQRLGLRQRDVELVSGQASRNKRLRVDCPLPRERIEAALLAS